MIRVVVSYTNILINLCYADQLHLLGRIPTVEFIIPPEIEREMRRGRGRKFSEQFSRAVRAEMLRVEAPTGGRAVEVYCRCRDEQFLDEGESAGLALAASGDFYFATT